MSSHTIKGTTRLLGLIGHGIGHTLSPLIHNTSAAHLGRDTVYVPFDIAEGQILNLLASMWQCEAQGFNITTPYKTVIARMVAGHGLASVNTLYRGKSGWAAASTDGQGFDRAAQRLGRPVHEWEHIVILGAGGAVAAILAHWHETRAKIRSIVVMRREAGVDQTLKMAAGSLPITFETMTPEAFAAHVTEREALVIQATNAPLKGDSLEQYARGMDRCRGAVSDLVYGRVSALVPRAKALGLPSQDGIPMLIEQARLSQEFWWGTSAPHELILHAIMQAAGVSDSADSTKP